MSYHVKPEDVPEELVAEVMWKVSGLTDSANKRNIAAILNAAIEAGLVSPPCYVVRNMHGNVCVPGTTLVHVSKGFLDENIPKGRGYVIEHWKGQTS